jgi:hypothetical protein
MATAGRSMAEPVGDEPRVSQVSVGTPFRSSWLLLLVDAALLLT